MKNVVRLCGVLLIALAASQALALPAGSWGGANGIPGTSDWTDPGNWTVPVPGPTVPDGTMEAHVNNASYASPVIVDARNIGRVVHDGGATITIAASGSLTNSGQYLMGNGAAPVNTLNVDGTLTNSVDVFAVGTNPGGVAALNIGGTGIVNAFGPWLIAGFGGAGAVGDITLASGAQLNVVNMLAIGWAGEGTLDVAAGANVLGLNVMNVGASGGTGAINLDGTIETVGLNLAVGSLDIGATGLYINNGGFAGGGVVTITGTGEIRFMVSPLVDVQTLIDGNPNWVFADGFGSSITENGDGSVSVTNAPEPLTLSLLAFGATALLRRKKA